jgi:hypothetical protein
MLTDRYHQAVAHAVQAHAGQVRKGTTIPYISHPLAVSALVLEFGGDEEQAIAGPSTMSWKTAAPSTRRGSVSASAPVF